MDNTPFFLIGCVRSGTTLLRDLLRRHPRLEAPEETHFFRWADPFGTNGYLNKYKKSKLFKNHVQMDGVSNFDFHYTLQQSLDRKEMSDYYSKLFLQARGNVDGRWFDKTPQNVYGALLINSYYPDSKFVHIYRNPLNVVTSLMEGKVMPASTMNASINYWVESIRIIEQFKNLVGERLIELRYESLCQNPIETIGELLFSLEEDDSNYPYASDMTHPEKNKYKKYLNKDQIKIIKKRCEPYLTRYGYE